MKKVSQYDISDERVREFFDFHHQHFSEGVSKSKYYAEIKLEGLHHAIEVDLAYARKVDEMLTNVSQSSPFYYILAERIGIFSKMSLNRLIELSQKSVLTEEDFVPAILSLKRLKATFGTVEYFITNQNTLYSLISSR